MIRHTKTLGIVQVDEAVWKYLSADEKDEIKNICDEKLETYFAAWSCTQPEYCQSHPPGEEWKWHGQKSLWMLQDSKKIAQI